MHYVPYTGSDYGSGYDNQLKLLIIGDSFNNDAWDPVAATEVVGQYLGAANIPFFAGVERIVRGVWTQNTQERREFWSIVAFANLLQEPVETASTVPTQDQWRQAWESFPETVRATKPDLIFFFTRRGWSAEGKFESEFVGSEVSDLHPKGRPRDTAYLRDFQTFEPGYRALSGAFDHPSYVNRTPNREQTYDLWHQWALRLFAEAPAILSKG